MFNEKTPLSRDDDSDNSDYPENLDAFAETTPFAPDSVGFNDFNADSDAVDETAFLPSGGSGSESQFANVPVEATNDPDRDAAARRQIEEMFDEHRDRLLRMIELRLQPELRSRVDANDVLQESFVEAFRQLRGGISAPKVSSLVWLRLIVGQQLVTFYRRYCQTKKREVGREISISAPKMRADPTSTSIFLVGKLTSPSVAARRAEMITKLRDCLEKLDPDDREILSLRHFEQLNNRETAEELNVAPNVASVRYLRALKKFRAVLQAEKLDELLE